MPRASILALLCGLFLLALPACPQASHSLRPAAQPSNTSGTASGSPQAASDADLRKAQRDELDQERRYYQARTDALTAKPTPLQQITPFITPLGAVVAVIVTLFTFFINYRSNQDNQQDTQFFEALKRFGDKDSPAVRASAAGLLAQLGALSRHSEKRKTPFLRTALDQLTFGLQLEENTVVLAATRAALLKLMEVESWSTMNALREDNLTLQKELAHALAAFLAVEPADAQGNIPEDAWNRAAAESGYRPLILKTLVQRIEEHHQLGKIPFAHTLEAARLRNAKTTPDPLPVTIALREAAMRLRNNADVLAEAILRFPSSSLMGGVFLCGCRFGSGGRANLYMDVAQLQDIQSYASMPKAALHGSALQGADLYSVDLEEGALFSCNFEGADLGSVNLKNADMQWANLQGAHFRKCTLDGTNLHGAKIDSGTTFYETPWWAANFFKPDTELLDEKLLGQFYDRLNSPQGRRASGFESAGTADSVQFDNPHPSVKEYFESRRADKN